MPDSKYTVVQHSAWAGKRDPQFETALESAAVTTVKEGKAVLKAGGLLFDSYGAAEDYAEKEQYPPGSGMFGVAPGTFSSKVAIGGRAVYVPVPPDVSAHIKSICEDAGLGVMVQVFEIVSDREKVTDAQLLALTAEDVTEHYEGWIGPAIDNVERSLLGDYS